jgi:hypothetical protein
MIRFSEANAEAMCPGNHDTRDPILLHLQLQQMVRH